MYPLLTTPQLSLLEELHLSYTGVTRLPSWIGQLKSLVIISCIKSKLTGSIPSSISTLPALSWLLLMENQLSGPLPLDIGNAAALTEIVVLQNRHYSLPPSLPTLS
jgi:Leucine-rich repeat (LRR) protein